MPVDDVVYGHTHACSMRGPPFCFCFSPPPPLQQHHLSLYFPSPPAAVISAAGQPFPLPSHHDEVFRGSSGGVVGGVGDGRLCWEQLGAQSSCQRTAAAKSRDDSEHGKDTPDGVACCAPGCYHTRAGGQWGPPLAACPKYTKIEILKHACVPDTSPIANGNSTAKLTGSWGVTYLHIID